MEALSRLQRNFTFICFLCGTILSLAASAPKTGAGGSTSHCLSKDPGLNDCVSKAADKLFKRMETGFKELGVPKMDPLLVTRMSINNGEGTVVLNLELINSTHFGLSKAQINSVKADPEKYSFDLELTFPEYYIKGMYNVSGKIILLPIMGTGPSIFNFTGVSATWKIKGEPKIKNGKTYMKIKEFIVRINPQKLTTRLDNLFNGNKQLGETMNKFLNDNWEEVYKQLKPAIEESFSQILLDLGNRGLSKIPYNQLFPDIAS